MSKAQLIILLNRILESLVNPFMINGQHISIHPSCGVTIFPEDDSPFQTY
jgi:GGDEF domain-containing protein